MTLISFFIGLQVILFFFITFHDWVHLPPLTDIRALEKHSTKKGRIINSVIFAICILAPLWATVTYQPYFPLWALLMLNGFYWLLTLGTIFSWWVPYFFGSADWHKQAFEEYRGTHHFLPAHGDNVIPNTFHVIMHLQIWTCAVISVVLLLF